MTFTALLRDNTSLAAFFILPAVGWALALRRR